ncbi:MAG TPA: hypothetical protein EYO29_00505 [Gammaproteobacteria bacterium]|jgi:hypothetical protein|nr:hypothetical protein [Gammaproteobacteria bacterium]PHS07866.1 MAG: hypothetical protein COA89_06060 [Acidithiobacillus sp.]HAD36961.1 hypothetical protein [Gammaproteobacteria bacterium]HBK75602.1 hypothetical protein [Gammaproteobacteria bacterium]HIB06343.1 hypothetical protein [Gammaproteobacteria bacterium]
MSTITLRAFQVNDKQPLLLSDRPLAGEKALPGINYTIRCGGVRGVDETDPFNLISETCV